MPFIRRAGKTNGGGGGGEQTAAAADGAELPPSAGPACARAHTRTGLCGRDHCRIPQHPADETAAAAAAARFAIVSLYVMYTHAHAYVCVRINIYTYTHAHANTHVYDMPLAVATVADGATAVARIDPRNTPYRRLCLDVLLYGCDDLHE